MNDKHHFTPDAPLRLASRSSQLALVQADIVCQMLVELSADTSVEVIKMVTKGDQVLDRPLVEIGGKGVFIKQLEQALLDGAADAAIHSMKDMETVIAPGTQIAAILPRADVRDALVGAQTLDELPQGARIGTASVRRQACLKYYRPDLDIQLLRGNVNSRLARLAEGEFDAIILAVAGLQRLGLDVAYSPIDMQIMPPSAAQGALAVQTPIGSDRADQIANIMSLLHDVDTADCVTAERALLAHLDGSCRTPISAYAQLQQDEITLYGAVLSADGTKRFEAEAKSHRADAKTLGTSLGAELLKQCGGKSFLA